jgi:hypothetical protein
MIVQTLGCPGQGYSAFSCIILVREHSVLKKIGMVAIYMNSKDVRHEEAARVHETELLIQRECTYIDGRLQI